MAVPRPLLFNHQVYSPRLQAEMLALGVRVSRPHLGLIVATLVLVTGRDHAPATGLWAWYLLACLVSTGGFLFRRRFLHIDREPPDTARLRRGELAGLAYSAAVGLVWGLSGLFMAPGQPEHNVLLTIIYLGVGAGAGSIAIFGLGHMLAGALLSCLLFVSRFPDIYPAQWGLLTVLFLLYHFVVVRMALERRDVIAENMRLRSEKDSLLEQQAQEVARTRQANQDKSAFLAAASHDLRQPVHALMLLSHALRRRVAEPESVVLVERILEAGTALADQFNNLMDLSRLEGGAYKLNGVRFALDEFLLKAAASHRQVAESRGLSLRLRMDRRLRKTSLHTDTGLLVRVLDNLLANAIKFSSPGGKVLLSARLQGNCLALGVHDNGPGIPADQQQHIFKPYVQLDNPTRDRARGIGLGLSIVQEATALLGGELRLCSRPGAGSHFRLFLDRNAVDLAAGSHGERQPPAPPVVAGLRGHHLLLVEDDPMAAAALMVWAEGQGLNVTHRAHPEQVDRNAAPDLILCDIRLPGDRDGIDCLAEWLDIWPDARGLLLSGELLPETHERAEQEGLLLLSKPVNPDLLLQTLSGLLRR
jgi:signal transduction histidine kinase